MKFVAIILALFIAAVVAQENQTNGTETNGVVAAPRNGTVDLPELNANGTVVTGSNGTDIPTSRAASENKVLGKTDSSVKTGKNSATVGSSAQLALVAVSCALAVKLCL